MRTARYLIGTAAAALAFAAPVPALAQQQSFQFDIAPQPLDSALRAFAQTTKQQVIFDPESVHNFTGALSGTFTTRAGLSQLLEGSGFEARGDSSGDFAIAPVQAEGAAQDPPTAPADSRRRPSPDTDQTIVVTGSRISRPNFDRLQPSVVIDSQQIENRGFVSVADALNEEPAFGIPGATPEGHQAGAFGTGQAFVNLFGLGAQRTLVLVDGRRFVSSNSPSVRGPTTAGLQVDLNLINTALIDRVETIAIGGAPIYGSDAIAGTVNIILKRDYEGAQLDGQYGISEFGDAANYRIRGIIGRNFADGRINVTASGEYNKGNGLLFHDRKVTREALFYTICRPGSSQFTECVYRNTLQPSLAAGGTIEVGGDAFGLAFPLSPQQQALFGLPGGFGVTDGAGNQLKFGDNGQLIPIDFGKPLGGPNDFNFRTEGGNGFDIQNTQQLLSDTERYNANLFLNAKISNNVRFFGEGWYSVSKARNLSDQPLFYGSFGVPNTANQPFGPLIISINNPYLTGQQRTLIQQAIINNPNSDQNLLGIANQNYFYLGRTNSDIGGSRTATSKTQVYRFVAGFDGTIAIGGRDIKWEVVGNYGHAKTRGRETVIAHQNFLNAINAIRDASGNIICAPVKSVSPFPTVSSTCAPFDPFGVGQMSQAALNYVTAVADPSSRNTEAVFTASANGPVLRLPGGDLKFALGFEHRYESTSFDPGVVLANGGLGAPILPVAGKFHTNEVFGELDAAIVGPSNRIPMVYSLELHGAARYVDHSTAGGDLTWTTEGRWAVIRDIAFRGNYTHAIRSPAITELYNPSTVLPQFVNDPCDKNRRHAGPDPATRDKNCTAAGLAQDFTQRAGASILVGVQGNPHLSNEKSDAWSAGVILTPRFIPGLSISADYISIKLDNAITQFTASQVAQGCFDSPDFPNDALCAGVVRDPTSHQITFLAASYFNASRLRYRGVLGALSYRTRTPFLGAASSINMTLQYQYLAELTRQNSASSAPITIDGTIGYPKHSAVLSLNYDNGPLSLFTSLNYTGPVIQSNCCEAFANNPSVGYFEHNRLNPILFVNAGISFEVAKRLQLRFMIDNLFSQDVPYPVTAFDNSHLIPYFSGVLGRVYKFGVSVKF